MIRLLGVSLIISTAFGLIIVGAVLVGQSLPTPPQVIALSQNNDLERLWLRFIDLERRHAVRQNVPGEYTHWVDIYTDPLVLHTDTGETTYGIHWYDPLAGNIEQIYSNTYDAVTDGNINAGWGLTSTPHDGLTFLDPGTRWRYLRSAGGTLHRLFQNAHPYAAMPLRWSPNGTRFLVGNDQTLLIGDAETLTLDELTQMEFDSSYVWDETGEHVLVSSYHRMEYMRLLDVATGEPDPVINQVIGFRARFTACERLLLYNTYDDRDRDRYHLFDMENGETWRVDPTEQIELDDLQWFYVLPDCERALFYATANNGENDFYLSDLRGDEMTLLAQFTRLVRLPDADGIYQYASVDGDITRIYQGNINAADFKRQIANLPALDQLAGWQITDDFVFYLREDGFYVQDLQGTYTDVYGKADETTLMYRYLSVEETP